MKLIYYVSIYLTLVSDCEKYSKHVLQPCSMGLVTVWMGDRIRRVRAQAGGGMYEYNVRVE